MGLFDQLKAISLGLISPPPPEPLPMQTQIGTPADAPLQPPAGLGLLGGGWGDATEEFQPPPVEEPIEPLIQPQPLPAGQPAIGGDRFAEDALMANVPWQVTAARSAATNIWQTLWAYPDRPAEAVVADARKSLTGMGIPADDLVSLAPYRGNKTTVEGGYYGAHPDTGGLPLVEVGPLTSDPEQRNRGRMVAIHEMLHAFEDLLNPDERAEIEQIRTANPLPDGLPARHHPEPYNITGYFDYSFEPSYSQPASEPYEVPTAVLDFIRRKMPEVKSRAELRNQKIREDQGLPAYVPSMEDQKAIEMANMYGGSVEDTQAYEDAGYIMDSQGALRKPTNLREQAMVGRREQSQTQQEQAGPSFEDSLLSKEIPYARAINKLISPITGPVLEAGGRIAGATVEGTPLGAAAGLLGLDLSETGATLGRGTGENLVPVHAWELGIELLPGVGAVPGTASLIRRLGREGFSNMVIKAAAKPQPGSPMFSLLVKDGAVLTPEKISAALADGIAGPMLEKAGQKFYHGTTVGRAGSIGDQGLNPMAGLATDREHAETFARTAARDAQAAGEEGAVPTILEFSIPDSSKLKKYTVPSSRLGHDVDEFYSQESLFPVGARRGGDEPLHTYHARESGQWVERNITCG